MDTRAECSVWARKADQDKKRKLVGEHLGEVGPYHRSHLKSEWVVQGGNEFPIMGGMRVGWRSTWGAVEREQQRGQDWMTFRCPPVCPNLSKALASAGLGTGFRAQTCFPKCNGRPGLPMLEPWLDKLIKVFFSFRAETVKQAQICL